MEKTVTQHKTRVLLDMKVKYKFEFNNMYHKLLSSQKVQILSISNVENFFQFFNRWFNCDFSAKA